MLRIVSCLALGLTVSVSALAQVTIPDQPDPLVAGLTIPADAPTRGMVSPVRPWPLLAIHSALLPTGAVLTFGSPLSGGAVQDGRTFDVWDQSRGLDPSSHTTLANAQDVDSFCATGAYLTTGSMLLSGGASYSSNYSAQVSTTFSPTTERASTVTARLAFPRWYGTMVTLADGRALIVGGGRAYANGQNDPEGAIARGDISMTPEVYSPSTGWSTLTGATSRDAFGPDFNRWWYPRLWVAPNGRVFGISAEKMWELNPAGSGAVRTIGNFKQGYSTTARPNVGPTSTAVMFDTGRILQVGGNGGVNGQPTPSSAAATVIDINGAVPVLREQAPMANPRQWANATVLPNGRVLVTGGSRFADNAGADAVLASEIWNPATGAWSTAASLGVYRGYHSTALLLPNGAVLIAGGGAPGPATNYNAEIVYPPYLFRTLNGRAELAPRPRVARISSRAGGYGQSLTIDLAATTGIAQASLVALGSGTHSFDSGQRRVPLRFLQSGAQVSVTLPASANLAPPGYYMLFLIDRAGVPSRAVIVSVGGIAPVPAARPAPPTLPVDLTRNFQSVNFPDRLVQHTNFLGFINPVGPASTTVQKRMASWIPRRSPVAASCYTLESLDWPGYFLRHRDFRVRMDRRDGSTAFDRSATWCPRQPLTIQPDSALTSLEALDWPGFFIRHRGFELWMDRFDGTPIFKQDGTFRVQAALQ